MKWNMLFGSMMLGLSLCSQSFGFDVLDRMLGANGCGCKTSCCEVNSCCKPSCAAAAPSGCCENAAPSCCEKAAPTSCCNAAAPSSCCENAGPSCGAAEPACGAESPCGSSCGKKCCHKPLLGNLKNLFGKRKCCGTPSCCETSCEPTCEAPACDAPACCHAAEPACGAETSCCPKKSCCKKPCLLDRIFGARHCKPKHCGCSKAEPTCGCNAADPACGCEAACGAEASAPAAAPAAAPTPAPAAEAAPMPPAPIVDPSAFIPTQRRVVQASATLVR